MLALKFVNRDRSILWKVGLETFLGGEVGSTSKSKSDNSNLTVEVGHLFELSTRVTDAEVQIVLKSIVNNIVDGEVSFMDHSSWELDITLGVTSIHLGSSVSEVDIVPLSIKVLAVINVIKDVWLISSICWEVVVSTTNEDGKVSVSWLGGILEVFTRSNPSQSHPFRLVQQFGDSSVPQESRPESDWIFDYSIQSVDSIVFDLLSDSKVISTIESNIKDILFLWTPSIKLGRMVLTSCVGEMQLLSFSMTVLLSFEWAFTKVKNPLSHLTVETAVEVILL